MNNVLNIDVTGATLVYQDSYSTVLGTTDGDLLVITGYDSKKPGWNNLRKLTEADPDDGSFFGQWLVAGQRMELRFDPDKMVWFARKNPPPEARVEQPKSEPKNEG